MKFSEVQFCLLYSIYSHSWHRVHFYNKHALLCYSHIVFMIQSGGIARSGAGPGCTDQGALGVTGHRPPAPPGLARGGCHGPVALP